LAGGNDDLDRKDVFDLKRKFPQFDSVIEFKGQVSFEQLQTLVRGAHAICCPSSYEGFGLPVLEAAASGKLVVHSDIPPFIEILGQRDLSFKSDSMPDLVRCLDVLSQDYSSLEWISERNHQRAKTFTWTKLARIIEAELKCGDDKAVG
jgi:glycosyltransferase involved in cell wall biosynthesis